MSEISKVGRPSLFKEEYCEEVENYCLLGATDKELAVIFETTEQTINAWKKQYPEFLESIKKGKDKADGRVARRLYDKAMDGDTTAMIFWLKNRRKTNWREKQEIEHKGDFVHTVNVNRKVKVGN